MPLVDMTSDLTSLKYGMDRRGGGWSGQPYFRQDPPNRLRSQNFATSFLGNDFLIRGGVRSVSAVLEDEIRLTNYLTNLRSPNGLLFIAKQNLLAKQAPLTGTAPDRIYNPLNTLAQAAVNPIGIHFAKQGRELRIDDNEKYFSKTKNKETGFNTNVLGEGNRNKMLLLYETNLITPEESFTRPITTTGNALTLGAIKGSLTSLINNIRNKASEPNNVSISKTNRGQFGISDDPQLLFQYQGGPNAAPGQKTAVRRVFNTNDAIDNNKKSPNSQFVTFTHDLLKDIERSTTTGFSSTGIADFRQTLYTPEGRAATGVQEERLKKLIGLPTDYSTFNRASKYGEGNPGQAGRNKAAYYTTTISSSASPDPDVFQVDQVNAQPLYSSRDESARSTDGYNDIIKFNIGVIDLNSTSNPKDTTWLHFRASITNFDDSYTAEWQPYKYMGRGNNFYKYNGFTRAISMGFEVVVYSKYEQAFVYDKLNYLASVIAPNYSDGGFMRGNLIKLTVGDYVTNTIGILNSINYTIPDDSPWDIGRNIEGDIDGNSLQLPQRITVGNFSFTPIHNFLERSVSPRYAKGEFSRPDENYISLGNGGFGYDFTQEGRKRSNDTKTQTQG